MGRMKQWKLNDVGETTFTCTDEFRRERILKVRRIRRGAWFAKIVGETEHSRWGDKQQIREDISNFLATCALPRGKRMW